MWSNNTMFKYDETRKQLQSVCFIDWQVMRYSSPVLDLMYFIFSCTTRELRGRNYNVYLKTYHDCLTQFIKRYKRLQITFMLSRTLNEGNFIENHHFVSDWVQILNICIHSVLFKSSYKNLENLEC